MSEVTTGTGTVVVPAPSVIVDVEATIKAEVAKAVAALKAEEVSIVTKVKALVAKYWPHVSLAVAGYAASAFGVIEKILKFL
jgi:hypothetical protein